MRRSSAGSSSSDPPWTKPKGSSVEDDTCTAAMSIDEHFVLVSISSCPRDSGLDDAEGILSIACPPSATSSAGPPQRFCTTRTVSSSCLRSSSNWDSSPAGSSAREMRLASAAAAMSFSNFRNLVCNSCTTSSASSLPAESLLRRVSSSLRAVVAFAKSPSSTFLVSCSFFVSLSTSLNFSLRSRSCLLKASRCDRASCRSPSKLAALASALVSRLAASSLEASRRCLSESSRSTALRSLSSSAISGECRCCWPALESLADSAWRARRLLSCCSWLVSLAAPCRVFTDGALSRGEARLP
mmetsp:Transcript_96341/g.176446  ORF Transcript_96341/g.176446 Transcript_96341/m.176446 type:complete len:299 (+) Transcript_96341:477-1373(+)